MLQTIINLLTDIGNSIWGFIQTAGSFFRLIFKIFNIFSGSVASFNAIMPSALGIVCSVSLLIFVVKIVLGSSSDG